MEKGDGPFACYRDDSPLQSQTKSAPSSQYWANQELSMMELYRLRNSHALQRRSNNGWSEEVDAGTYKFSVTYGDICSTALSIIMRAITVFINIKLAYYYYNVNGAQNYFIWTTICIVVPMCITTLIYAYMCHQDGKFKANVCIVTQTIWVVFPVSFLFRYWKSLIYSVRCKHAELRGNKEMQLKYFKLTIREESDVAFLRLFECFLEAAPQKILQISIALRSFDKITNLQILAIISYFGSMAWCLGAYHRCNRFAQIDKYNINSEGLVLQLCWHFCISVSRTLCISFVASLFPIWMIVACLLHAVLFGFVTFILDPPRFSAGAFVKFVFCLIFGIVCVFTYIPITDAPTRWKYVLYYLICSIENIVCVTIFILFASTSLVSIAFLFYPLCAIAIAFYYVGIVFMIIYYLYFHPKITSRNSKSIINNN